MHIGTEESARHGTICSATVILTLSCCVAMQVGLQQMLITDEH